MADFFGRCEMANDGSTSLQQLGMIAEGHPTAAEAEDENWGVGGQREFDENFNCNNSALDGIELPGTYAKGHGIG